MDLYSALVP